MSTLSSYDSLHVAQGRYERGPYVIIEDAAIPADPSSSSSLIIGAIDGSMPFREYFEKAIMDKSGGDESARSYWTVMLREFCAAWRIGKSVRQCSWLSDESWLRS